MPRTPQPSPEPDRPAGPMGPSGGAVIDPLARLDVAMRLREFHHNAIWEEQKHFTWMLSAVLTAQLFAITSDGVSSSLQAFLGSALGLVGTAIAITAFRVQRREGEYMRNTQVGFVRCYNAVFGRDEGMPIPAPGAAANKRIRSLIAMIFLGRPGGVRDYFQALLLSFTAVFGASAVFAIAT